jgi:glutamate---cysteine ligase / carboxylate-amine ligase
VGEVGALSVGVEEEFLLVDATTRALTPLAVEVLEDVPPGLDLQPEMTTFQVESATAVCRTMAEVRDELVRARRALAHRAALHGARLVASGTPVMGGRRPPLTDTPHYRTMEQEYGALVDGLAICGCHVHVGVPDAETGVLVVNHLRQWLPVLLALSANSPFADGRDTGYASWRYLSWPPWPTAGPPPWFDSVEDYRESARVLQASGAAMDERGVYWDVRLSVRHPTVELRVCDVTGTVGEAVLLAALVRGIAGMAMAGAEAFPVSDLALRAALWRAARDGLEGGGVEPRSGRVVAAVELVRGLVDWVRPALRAVGDDELVADGVGRLLADGCGAVRQRRAFNRRGEPADVVDFLVAQT